VSRILGASLTFRNEIDDRHLLRLVEQQMTLLRVVGAEYSDGMTTGLVARPDALDTREQVLCNGQVTSVDPALEIGGLESLAKGPPSNRLDLHSQIRLHTSCPEMPHGMCHRFKARDGRWFSAVSASMARSPVGATVHLDFPNGVWHSDVVHPLLKGYFKENLGPIIEMLAKLALASPSHYKSAIFESGSYQEGPLASWLYQKASMIPQMQYL
jgi:hypothetical protein